MKVLLFCCKGFEMMEFAPFYDVIGWAKSEYGFDVELETCGFSYTVPSAFWNTEIKVDKSITEGRKKMKYQYKEMPESMKGTYGEFAKNFGFDWKEFIMGIPTPMFLVTTYKSNGQPNATMQSWAGFTSANHGGGYYVILCSVNKGGHLYQSLNEKKAAVLNFMSSDLYKACMETIQNNQFETDEITSSGLTVEKASWIEAPMVAECFMNLECQYLWEKEIVPGDDHVMICFEVVGGHIEKDYMEDMFGSKGVLYNVHYPINPEDVKEKGCDYVAALRKVNQSYEY